MYKELILIVLTPLYGQYGALCWQADAGFNGIIRRHYMHRQNKGQPKQYGNEQSSRNDHSTQQDFLDKSSQSVWRAAFVLHFSRSTSHIFHPRMRRSIFIEKGRLSTKLIPITFRDTPQACPSLSSLSNKLQTTWWSRSQSRCSSSSPSPAALQQGKQTSIGIVEFLLWIYYFSDIHVDSLPAHTKNLFAATVW